MKIRNPIPWRFQSKDNFFKAYANYFFKEIRSTAPINCNLSSDREIHILVCKRDINMCLIAIKSFLRFYDNIKIIIHEDGSLDNVDKLILKKHIPGARLISKTEADIELSKILPEDILIARSNNVFLMKVFDFNFFSTAKQIIILDSDIIFTKPPCEIINWLDNNETRPFYNSDPLKYTFRGKHCESDLLIPNNFNAGFIGYNNNFRMDQIICAIRKIDYFLEDQSIYAFLLAPLHPQPLDPDRYHVYEGGKIQESAKMIHFISSNRFSGGVYFSIARKACSEMKKYV